MVIATSPNNTIHIVKDITSIGTISETFQVPNDITAMSIYLTGENGIEEADLGNYTIFQWVKLELGSIATPFCPPNHATELLKIQAMDGTIPADTLDGKHASDFALKTDIPTTLPANGGNADTLGNIPASELERVRTAIMGGEAMGLQWTAIQARKDDTIIRVQADADYDKIILCKSIDGGVTWTEIPLGNADTVDGKHASDFLHSSGFAGQIEKLFYDVDTTDDLSSLFSIVPDDATLRKLNPGIYAVTTSAARNSLGIPKEGWASGSSLSTKEAIQTPGGILIKFGRVFGGPNLNRNRANVMIPGTFTDACAFFINNNGIIYHTSTVIDIAPDGGTPTVSWMPWTVFLSNTWNCSDQITINSVKYLSSDVTVAAGGTFDMYILSQMWKYPYTSGIAYGPTKSYSLSLSSNGTALTIKNNNSSDLVLPAGQYLIKLT